MSASVDLKKWNLPLWGLFLAALGLRLFRLDFRSIWLDEAYSLKLAAASWDGIIRGAAMDIHPPLYYLLLSGWVRLFGSSEWAARSLSALLGALLVPAVFLLARALAGQRAAWWTAGLAACSPYLIEISRSARMAGLLAVTSILSLYFFWRVIAGGTWKHGLGYWFFMLAALYTHYFAFLLLFAQYLYLFMGIKQLHLPKPVRQRWLQLQILLAAGFAPWLATFWAHALKGGPAWRGVGAAWHEPVHSLYQFLVGTACWTGLDKTLALGLLAAACAILAWNMISKPERAFALMSPRAWGLVISVLLVPLGLVWLYSWNRMNVFDNRYLSFAAVMLLLPLGLGLSAMPRRAGLACGFLLLAAFAVPLRNQYFVYGYYDNWRAAANWLKTNTLPQDIIGVYPPWNQTPLEYYLGQERSLQGLPGRYDPITGETENYFMIDPESVHQLQFFFMQERAGLVLVNTGEAQAVIWDWFRSRFTLQRETVLGGIRLSLWQRRRAP